MDLRSDEEIKRILRSAIPSGKQDTIQPVIDLLEELRRENKSLERKWKDSEEAYKLLETNEQEKLSEAVQQQLKKEQKQMVSNYDDKLKQQTDLLKSEIENLKQELNIKKTQYSKLTSDNISLRRNVENLEHQNDQQTIQVNRLNAKVDQLTAENLSLKQATSESNRAVQNLEQQSQSLADELRAAQRRQQQQLEEESLKQAQQQASAQTSPRKQEEQQSVQDRSQSVETLLMIESLKAKNESHEKDSLGWRQQKDRLAQENLQLKNENDVLKRDAQRLMDEIERKNAALTMYMNSPLSSPAQNHSQSNSKSESNELFADYMQIRGHVIKSWTKYFFVLRMDSNTLQYFADESRTYPKGTITDLSDCKLEHGEKETGKKHSYAISNKTSKKVEYLAGESDVLRKFGTAWKDRKKSLRTPQNSPMKQTNSSSNGKEEDDE